MGKEIRVLHLCNKSLPDSIGGIETVVDNLAKRTAALGFKVKVLSTTNIASSPDQLRLDNYDLIQAQSNIEIASCRFSFKLFKLFKNLAKDTDIIHYHFPWPFMDILNLAIKDKQKTVLTYHSDIIRQGKLMTLYKPLMSSFLNSVDKIVCTSPNYLASSDTLKRFSEKAVLIPIGIDQSDYPEVSESELAILRKKYPEKFFLFIGRLVYYKGLHFLIEAAKDLGCDIVIAGSGPLEDELRNHVKKLALDNIHFTGQIYDKEKTGLLTLAYGFVFPSYMRSEAFGISLLEAAMFGKPLITFNLNTGVNYINVDNETGIVTKSFSASELRNSMLRLLTFPDITKKFGANARKRYLQLFSSDLEIDKYCRLYKSLLQD